MPSPVTRLPAPREPEPHLPASVNPTRLHQFATVAGVALQGLAFRKDYESRLQLAALSPALAGTCRSGWRGLQSRDSRDDVSTPRRQTAVMASKAHGGEMTPTSPVRLDSK